MDILLPDEESVMLLHEMVLMVSPGKEGVHDRKLIIGAIQRPQTYTQYVADYDVDTICALLIDSLARNHAFKDGNKRTALMTAIFTYRVNMVHFRATQEMNMAFDKLIMKVVLNKPNIDEITTNLKEIRQTYEGQEQSWYEILAGYISAKINHD